MAELIPLDQTRAEELNSRLSSTMFRSTSEFITFYNSGLINKSNDEVAGIAEEIAEIYKNVKLQSKTFLFISRTEVELSEVLVELRHWDFLVKVKRALSDLVSEGVIEGDAVVEFKLSSPGVLFAHSEDGEASKRLADEKFLKPSDEDLLLEVHGKYSNVERSGDSVPFVVTDLTDLDDSFVSTLYTTVFEA